MKLNEIKKEKDPRPNTWSEVEKWTKADWDMLWDNPSVEQVMTWCHGNHHNESYRYMWKAKPSQISIKGGRVHFTTKFAWMCVSERLPFKLGKVGDFDVYHQNAPKAKRLTTTEGFPTQSTAIRARYMAIENITEFPKKVDVVSFNGGKIKSFKGLEHLSGINVSIEADDCPIESLDGLPRTLGRLYMSSNKIKSLKGIDKRFDQLKYLNLFAPIEDGMLDLVKIPGLLGSVSNVSARKGTENDVSKAFSIIKKYCKGTEISKAQILECQEELLDADLDDLI